MPIDLTKTREEYSRIHKEAEDLVNTVAAANRGFTPEEDESNKQRFKKLEELKGVIDGATRLAGLAFAEGRVETPGSPRGKEEFDTERGIEGMAAGGKFNRELFGKALTAWGRDGVLPQQFATITTATASGALLPKEVAMPIVGTTSNIFRDAFGLYGITPVTTGSTANLSVPVVDATAGGQVAENATSDTENAPALTESINLNIKTYQSGSAWLSNQQLAAVDYDLAAELVPALVYSKELGVESAAVAAIIADAGITQSVATGTTTGFTYGNLVDLNRKLPKKYDRLKVIALGHNAFTYAEKLTDSQGRPLLVPDAQNQTLLRFNGTPVVRSDYFDDFGASKTIGMVFSLIGFRLRDVNPQNLARYINYPGKPNQTGFNLFAYHGWGYAPSAVASLKTPAS